MAKDKEEFKIDDKKFIGTSDEFILVENNPNLFKRQTDKKKGLTDDD